MTEPQSGADILARIKPRLREEQTQICLRPDLLDAWEEATTELAEQQAADVGSPRLGSAASKSAQKLAAKVQSIEAEIEATAIHFRFRAMSKDKWQALCANHPPRSGNDMDRMVGYDRDGVLDAAVRECLIDPVFDQAAWAEFLEVCNPSEWEELRSTVNSVNRSVVDAPKSVLASRILSRRASGSGQPASGE